MRGKSPCPVSAVRCTDVRWAALYLAYMYWRGRFVPFKQFLLDTVKTVDDAPETVAKVLAFLTDSNTKVIKTQLAFVAHYIQPKYDLIASFQKQTGELAKPLKCLHDIKKILGLQLVVSLIPLCNTCWTLCLLHKHALLLLLHNCRKRHRSCATKLTICKKKNNQEPGKNTESH